MYRIVAAFAAAGLCVPPPAYAQADPPVLTLSQAIDRADAASPTPEAADAAIRAAEADRRAAGLRPNLSIVAESENIGGTGLYRGVRSAETTVGLSLPLELGGKRGARVALAEARIGRASVDRDIARADLRLRVTQAYIDAAAGQRRLSVAREQLAIASEVVRAARIRVRAGRASPIEEQRADVARLRAENAVDQAARTADLAAATLARLTGLPRVTVDPDWFGRLPPIVAAPVGPTLTDAAARADLTTAEASVRLAERQRIPDLTLNASARRLEQTDDTAAVIGVSIPLRLFDRGRAGTDAAVARRDQAAALRRAARIDADIAIARARTDADNATAAARLATGPALAAATEAARIARIGYREGKFGQLDLLDAERTLADTLTAAIDALAALHDARARLDRLSAPAIPDTRP